MRSVLYEKMEDDTPMYKLKGVLRKGEQESLWNRRVNWQTSGNYNWIDLNFMARLFRFSNP